MTDEPHYHQLINRPHGFAVYSDPSNGSFTSPCRHHVGDLRMRRGGGRHGEIWYAVAPPAARYAAPGDFDDPASAARALVAAWLGALAAEGAHAEAVRAAQETDDGRAAAEVDETERAASELPADEEAS